ncbi:hypothetical protein EVAR_5795_1 [Eumeta japonica]|uniref:Uncharacterized protein n=1 Tax=Eumeta variegata TaxID=151549 RepID=A0A4C1T742_EUMVA|nr:hypothetical protein EVAR_5795_1 [Eumeta japonica]
MNTNKSLVAQILGFRHRLCRRENQMNSFLFSITTDHVVNRDPDLGPALILIQYQPIVLKKGTSQNVAGWRLLVESELVKCILRKYTAVFRLHAAINSYPCNVQPLNEVTSNRRYPVHPRGTRAMYPLDPYAGSGSALVPFPHNMLKDLLLIRAVNQSRRVRTRPAGCS